MSARHGEKKPSREPVVEEVPPEGGSNAQREDTGSMTSSMCELHNALKDAGNADLRSNLAPHSGKTAVIFFTAASAISFALMLAACCPVPWYTSGSAHWSLWKDDQKVRWTDTNCRNRMQMLQTMEAYAIASCVLSMACLIAGFLQVMSRGHLGVTMALGVLTTITELVTWALAVNQFHLYNCPPDPVYSGVNRLDAGFALTISAFGLMFFTTSGLIYYFCVYFAQPQGSAASFSRHTLLSALLTMTALMLTVVGTTSTLWVNYFTGYTIKMNLWHIELSKPATSQKLFYSYKDYHCPVFDRFIQTGQAFAIISSAVLFANMLIAFAAVYKESLRWANLALSICSFCFLLVCWAVLVGARYKTFCPGGAPSVSSTLNMWPLRNEELQTGSGGEQRVEWFGYHIVDGLALIVSSFCIMGVTIFITARQI